jgi:hypothetical protein
MLFEIYLYVKKNLLMDFHCDEINEKKRILGTVLKYYLIKIINDSNKRDMILPELQPFHFLEDIVCVLDDLRRPILLRNAWGVH